MVLMRVVARRFLDLYRPQMACFNDDVQGTGCVTLAAIMAGLKVTGQTLRDVRMVVFGAGTAGVGIADQVRDAIATEGNVSPEEAAKNIWSVCVLASGGPYRGGLLAALAILGSLLANKGTYM